MALVLDDRVQETTTTTGTGTVTLAGASLGYQSFAAIGNGNTTYYCITDGTNWETGIGTYTSSGTTFSRDTVLESSNSGSLVNFPAGTKNVFVTYPASQAVLLNATQTLTNKTLTSPVIASIVNTGTLTLPTSTDILVGRATTDTLTNKTLTSPVIASIVNTGTLTLPTSTDTLVGRDTTDTLTNKTLTSPAITGAVVSSMASSVITAGTVVSVSGTSVGFTNIPSWVKRITLQLYAVSTNGTSGNLTAQFGTGGTPTYVTSGYNGTSSIIRGSTSTASAGAISSGFDLLRGLATTAFTSGTFVFTLVDVATDKWVCSAVIARSDEATTIFTAGYIDLSSTLTAVRLTTTTGVDSFDSGSLNILYE